MSEQRNTAYDLAKEAAKQLPGCDIEPKVVMIREHIETIEIDVVYSTKGSYELYEYHRDTGVLNVIDHRFSRMDLIETMTSSGKYVLKRNITSCLDCAAIKTTFRFIAVNTEDNITHSEVTESPVNSCKNTRDKKR